MENKICRTCLKPKALIDFHRQTCNRDGFNSRCKVCVSEYDKARHRTRPYKSKICKHGTRKNACKKCGVRWLLKAAGFTKEEIEEMGAVSHCQFPGCLVPPEIKALCSDHAHDGCKMSRENYRGEVCLGHNMLLAFFDKNSDWAKDYPGAKEYMTRRPYLYHNQK